MLQVDIEYAGYSEKEMVIQDISFSIQPGELIGLIGPNGAGKSTTIKTIIGMMKHWKGNLDFGKDSARSSYSYIPEQPILYDELTLWEHLELAAAAYGMDRASFEKEAHHLLDKFRLQEAKHLLTTGFSKGMQQKTMLMLCFLIKPDLYIVDEPFIGLDPRAIQTFLHFLEEERRRGAGVLMSTHVLDTAERICDSFILIDQGRIVAKGTLGQIRTQCGLPEATLFECFNQLT